MELLRMDPTSTEFLVMQAVIHRADEMMDHLDRRRAVHTANAVGRLFKK